MARYPETIKSLKDAHARGECSALALLVETASSKEEHYIGTSALEGSGAQVSSVNSTSLFDLASLTKILSTVSLLFQAESEGRFQFSDPVAKFFPAFTDKAVSLLDLMNHSSGLPAHIKFYERYQKGEAKLGDQNALENWILSTPVGTEKKQQYSDLGYLLLGFLLEKLYGKPLPLIFEEQIRARLKLENAGFVCLAHAKGEARFGSLLAPKERFVATERCPWRGKIIQGEVHDDNCWAAGGYGGHAGLFANAQDTLTLLHHLRRQLSASPSFRLRLKPEAGSFSFGTMTYPGLRPFPGNAFAESFGHTGFVGTSAWHHAASGTSVVLLSNRVHPSREDTRWIDTRLRVHALLWDELGL